MLRIAHIPTHHTSAGLIIRTSAYQSGLPASAPSNSLPSVPVLSLPAKFPAVSTRRASRHEEVRDRGDPRGQVMGRSLKRSRTVYMVEEIGRPSLVRTAIPVSISEGIEKANPVGQGKPGGLRSEDLVIRQKAAHGSVTPPGRTRPGPCLDPSQSDLTCLLGDRRYRNLCPSSFSFVFLCRRPTATCRPMSSESAPSLKRARVEDGDQEPAPNPRISNLQKDDDVWLSDGSIVVAAADNVAFRVHKSTLSRRSEIFNDLFSLPNADKATAETMDGCPVVRVTDSSADIRHLLLVLCCGKKCVPVFCSLSYLNYRSVAITTTAML